MKVSKLAKLALIWYQSQQLEKLQVMRFSISNPQDTARFMRQKEKYEKYEKIKSKKNIKHKN